MKKHLLTLIAGLGLAGSAFAGSFDFLFIHHSVGRNWLSDGLRADLQNTAKNRHVFTVHDVEYNNTIGHLTDVNHWYPKFRDQMQLVRTFDRMYNVYYQTPGRFNQVVMFKSCYPNSGITSMGTLPGNPTSPLRTVYNHQAAYNACANEFKKYPDMLFVAVTAPPLNPLGTNATEAGYARQFHNWLKTTWVQNYQATTGLKNVVVFDLFDVLANSPSHATEANMLKAAYRVGNDSHPTKAGNLAATTAFIPFINNAVDAWKGSTGNNGGCPGYNNLVPSLAGNGPGKIGSTTFAVQLTRGRPLASAILLASASSTQINLAGGCYLYTGTPWVSFPVVTDGAGAFSSPLPIPYNPALVGGHVYFQAFIYDQAGPIGPNILTGSSGLDTPITY